MWACVYEMHVSVVVVYLPIFISYHDYDYREWNEMKWNGITMRIDMLRDDDWPQRKAMWKKREENFCLHIAIKEALIRTFQAFFWCSVAAFRYTTTNSTDTVYSSSDYLETLEWWERLPFDGCSCIIYKKTVFSLVLSVTLWYFCFGWRFL